MKNLDKLINFAIYDIPRNQLARAKFGNTSRLFRQSNDPDYEPAMRAEYNSRGLRIPYSKYKEITHGNKLDPADPYAIGVMTDPGFRQISRNKSFYTNEDDTYSNIAVPHDVVEFKLNGNMDWDKVFSYDPYAWQYLQLVTSNPNNNKFTGMLLNDWENSYRSLIPNINAFTKVSNGRKLDSVDPRAIINLNSFLLTNKTGDYAKLEEYWNSISDPKDKDVEELRKSLRFLGTQYNESSEDSDIRSLNNAQCLYILNKIKMDTKFKNDLQLALGNKVSMQDVYKLLDNVFDGHIYDSSISKEDYINNKNEYQEIKTAISDCRKKMKYDSDVNRGAASFAKYIKKKSFEELSQKNEAKAKELTESLKQAFFSNKLTGVEKLLAYGQFNKAAAMEDRRVSKLVNTRPRAQDDKKIAEYLAQSMSNAELNEVLKSLDMDDKIEVIIGYANTNHAKLDDKFRKMIGYSKDNSVFGYKLQVSRNPMDNKLGIRTRNLNDDRVLKEKLATMSRFDIDKILKHINEESNKDQSTAMRVSEASKVLKDDVLKLVDAYSVGMKFLSYIFILDPKNPFMKFNKFLKNIKNIYRNFNDAKENIVKFQREFLG